MTFKKIISQLNFISFYGLMILPLAYIFSSALINLIVIIIVLNFLVSSYNYKNYLIKDNNFFKIVIIFWLYISIQSFFLDNANSLKSIFYLRFLLLPFAIAYLLNNNLNKINTLKFFYLFIVMLVIIDILIQFYTGKDLFGYRADHINGFFGSFENWNTHKLQRFAGPFGFSKRAGTFILIFGIIGYFLNQTCKNNLNIYFNLIFIIILTSSIIITGDRSPFLCLLILFVLMFFLEKNYRKLVLIISTALFTIFILFLSFSKTVNYRYIDNIAYYSKIIVPENKMSQKNLNDLKVKNNSFNKRLKKIIYDNPWSAHYFTAFEIFKSSPIFGKGVRSFRFECIKYPNINSSYADLRCSTHPHNTLFELLSEVGILGLIIFSLILYELFKLTKQKLYLNNIFFFLIISLIIPIKPTGAIFSSWFGSILWLIIGFYFWEKNRYKVKSL